MTECRNIVLLVGGVGGAKLAYGLAHAVPPEYLTIIVNTGDDFWHYGLRICPDLDTITYTLAGVVDPANGWGLQGDTTITLEALSVYGMPWFRLGDKDLATHLFRTQQWHEGRTLTEITRCINQALGVKCTLLPMTNTPVATMVETVEYGEIAFQVYFVKHRWQPQLKALRLDGIEQAIPGDAVCRAMQAADLILIGPSNPWLSINPILSVPGMRELIAAQDVPRVAVTPIINGQAVKGPTAKIMAELNLSPSAETVAHYYDGIINGFVYDQRDPTLEIQGIKCVAFDTLMDSNEKRITLAEKILQWTSDWKN